MPLQLSSTLLNVNGCTLVLFGVENAIQKHLADYPELYINLSEIMRIVNELLV